MTPLLNPAYNYWTTLLPISRNGARVNPYRKHVNPLPEPLISPDIKQLEAPRGSLFTPQLSAEEVANLARLCVTHHMSCRLSLVRDIRHC